LAYLEAIEIFGLPDVDDASDLTEFQLNFIHTAHWKREEIKQPDEEDVPSNPGRTPGGF
jgi:hypothetical protein